MDPHILIPISEIDANALPRDRTQLEPEALAELAASIAATGLRQPIEVWRLSQPTARHRYGLISGLRRLTAHQRLAALRQKLGPLKAPKSLIWREDWPMLASGKTDLKALEATLWPA